MDLGRWSGGFEKHRPVMTINAPAEIVGVDGILQVHWTFPPTTGGVESHVADLAAAMAGGKRRVVVLTGERNPVRCEQYTIVSTPLLDLETIKTSPLPKDVLLSRFRELLAQVISQYRIRVIHGHNLHHFHPSPALAIETVRQQFDLRVFHTFHETWPDLLSESPVYKLWNGNYAVSRHVQEQCQSILGFTPELHRLGVDIGVFRSKTACFASGRHPVILHPARLLPWKGVDVGIRALRLLIDRGYRTTLVITDTQRIADWNTELDAYRERITHLVDDLQLASNVRFQRAAYVDMPSLYERADIVIYPTIGEEPYGLVPIEAMSCARPIVASNSGGIPETVLDGVTGHLVPKGDIEALASRLAGLLSNPRQARRFGAAGRRHVSNNFDSERYASALLEHYAEAVSERTAAM
jgi:glycosyltransferase involved in cell wall biosynthesis